MKSFIFLFSFFLAPLAANATVIFTEVMYDLPGADSGREWVEIYNDGSESVTIATTTWKFFEANTNHGLSLFQGSTVLVGGGYAIIADEPQKFLIDWPAFSGTIFDSTFSLSNSGEALALKSSTTTITDQVTYDPTIGGGGDGLSLQKVGGLWVATTPTPGVAAITNTPPDSSSSDSGTATSSPDSSSSPDETASPLPAASSGGGGSPPPEPQISVRAIAPLHLVAGADAVFDANAFGFKKEPLPNARFVWSFGDGATAEGKKVLHAYHLPALYVVMVEASSGEWSATDRADIGVVAPQIVLSRVRPGPDGFIEIKNNGAYDLDLSRWFLRSGSAFFSFPKGTVLKKGGVVPFASVVTKLLIDPADTALLYPNGTEAVRYSDSSDEPLSATPPSLDLPTIQSVPSEPVPEREGDPRAAPRAEEVPPTPEATKITTTSDMVAAVGETTESRTSSWVWAGWALLVTVLGAAGYLWSAQAKIATLPPDEHYEIVE